jgi:eukaryotic-like serine/threonine-protein kinase
LTRTRAKQKTFANGRYTVERLLGSGGMATVYCATDRELERRVAVKVIDRRFSGDDGAADRFRREALTIARISHPNVVAVFDAGEEDGDAFIVMEYVDGGGLDTLLAQEERLDSSRLKALALQACDGLGAAHARGIVHRDVKPANLLLDKDGGLKVSDFGIAHSADATTQLTQPGTVLGTMSYLAPEQATGEHTGPQADVFSLGVVMYEALTGATPWRVETIPQLAAIAAKPPKPLRKAVPDIPRDLEATVLRCLARDPAARPQDGAALARELRGDDEAPTVLMERTRVKPARRRLPVTPRQAVVGAAALVAAIVLIFAFVLVQGDNGLPPPSPAPARVQPVPEGADAQTQAANLEEWLRDHTRKP